MPFVQVFVRPRPLLPAVASSASTARITINEFDNTVTVVGSVGREAGTARTFAFDRVFPPNASQEDVFDAVRPLVSHAIGGLHATIFAYGQTGSGKTHTIDGLKYTKVTPRADIEQASTPAVAALTDSRPLRRGHLHVDASDTQQHGIALRAIQYFFDEVQLKPHQRHFRLMCSFYQLYNEKVSDLLRPRAGKEVPNDGLRIRWGNGDTFYVENLFVCTCESAEQMRDVFLAGVKKKVMGSNAINAQSSRSHTVFTIYVHSWDLAQPAGGAECLTKSEFSLVDLAGSERLAQLARDPSGLLVRESIEINASLLALGKVIMALSSATPSGPDRKSGSGSSNFFRQVAASHIPYRDSKLTKLLKHAVGGNSMTTMIACINLQDRYIEESASTLLYAGRARNIRNAPHVNTDPKAALIKQLREEVASLNQELRYYRSLAEAQMATPESGGNAEPRCTAAASSIDGLGEQAAPALQSGARHADPCGGTDQKEDGGVVAVCHREADERNGAQLPAGAPPLDDRPRCSESGDVTQRDLHACEMLKNVIRINGKLREALDALKAAHAASEQREVALNAENLLLRERISSLEAIALDDALRGGAHPVCCEAEVAAGPGAAERADADAEELAAVGSPQPAHSDDDGAPRRAVDHGDAPSEEVGTAPCERKVARVAGLRSASRGGRRGRLSKRLQAYSARYYGTESGVGYDAFYRRAWQCVPHDSEAARAVRDVQKALQKLPPFVMEIIPDSLKGVSAFGSLSFGGQADDRRELERRRHQRQQERQAMLAHQSRLRCELAHMVASAQGGATPAEEPPLVSQPLMPAHEGRVGTGRRRAASASAMGTDGSPLEPRARRSSWREGPPEGGTAQLLAYLARDRVRAEPQPG